MKKRKAKDVRSRSRSSCSGSHSHGHGRSRSRSRGSVIVESLVVTPLLIILCSMSFFAFRMHHEKLSLMREGRESLWATATTSDCGMGGKVTSYPAPDVRGGDMSLIPETLPGGPNQGVIDRPLRTASATMHRSVRGDPTSGAQDRQLRTSATMMCNEPIEDGRQAQMRRIAAENFP